MKRQFIIVVVLLLSTLSCGAQAIITDSILTHTVKQNTKRYDGYKSFDTLFVKDKLIITTKREMRRDYLKLTKGVKEEVVFNGDTMDVKKGYQLVRKNNRDSIRSHKNVWGSILGGPAYTPEASLGLGGAALLTFKFNPRDSIVNRSILPFGFLVSINKTFMLAGGSEFFFKQNRIQLNTEYGIRYEPDNYFGVGYDVIDKNYKSDSTTQYTRMQVQLKPILSFRIADNILLGPILDYTYYNLLDPNEFMKKDAYYNRFDSHYLSAGIGVNFRYDSRDNPSMPYEGVRLNISSLIYGKYLGGTYNYTYSSLDYRQYQRMFKRRSVLAWTARIDISTGNVPLTALPTFGSPTDLRGYAKGHYRDKTMGYAITEYRHMFGSQEVYDARRPFVSRLGFVVWGGVGTIGNNVNDWDKFKWNYGFGFRYEVQPHNNFRLDVGKSPHGKWMVYMNMIEAF
ncbi:MAG: BamA/TamA family outer membrane protein [Rikenellaceae bacterium]